jgi:hypothetical protein
MTHTNLNKKLREEITELDRRSRSLAGILSKIHSTPSDECKSEIIGFVCILSYQELCRQSQHLCNLLNLSLPVAQVHLSKWLH